MRFIGNQGDPPQFVIYELDGQQVIIPANTAPENVESAVLAALAEKPDNRPFRQQYNNYITNNQDLLQYSPYFLRLHRDLLDIWKTAPNLTNTTTAVYKALRAGKDTTAEITDPDDLAMYNRFLWFVQRTTNTVLVSGDLPPAPTAAQAQVINQAAHLFAIFGSLTSGMLMRG